MNEVVFGIGILIVVVLLGMFALIFLKQKYERENIKDLLGIKIQIEHIKAKTELSRQELTELSNLLKKLSEDLKGEVETLKETSSNALIATQTILKEYEVNGIPLGYDRKGNKVHFDEIEGL